MKVFDCMLLTHNNDKTYECDGVVLFESGVMIFSATAQIVLWLIRTCVEKERIRAGDIGY